MQANLKASLAILEADIAPVDVSVCCCTSSSVPSASTQWRQNNKHDHTGTSPVNMPDPIRKRFGYGQLWPLRPACSQNRAGSCICWIRLPASFSVPFFQRRHGPYLQNRPGSDLDGLARVWLNSSGLKASWCAGMIGLCFWQDTKPACCCFPFSGSVAFFHRHPG